ncbi:putative pyruvate decarboxylase C13A11.06 [Hypsizygus marmoreus]|uniref:Pyruvate decarboxylase C13A11.06 n=1 Tax=Hypsizygus marmoreus TaxID=39966 RepID=A0A369JA19_HYPMA|nr:putative pyruvate decarboxylase C13A11.06 [Hypsizygus marmoreus]
MASQTTAALQAEVNRLQLQVDTLKAEQGNEHISIGNYILARLAQLGVTNVFGVPGDFNLGFLDLIEDHPTLNWVGNCNELNAAYAADGYARVKEHSIGVVVTTFGVGELSAINGIAGAFSEMVPVLHLVGAPSTSQHAEKPMLHHTLGDGRYDAYIKAAKQVTAFQSLLSNKNDAASQIDRALTESITLARPVYLSLPTDLVHTQISSDRLHIPLSSTPPRNDPSVEAFVIDLIVQRFAEAEGDAIVLVDACAIRHDVRQEINDFLRKTGFPVYAAPMGKTAVDESFERYGGIYLGTITQPDIKEKVESAKLILSVGCLRSDFNTGNFSYNIPIRRTIELHSDHTKVQFATFPAIGMKQLIPKLTERLLFYRASASKIEVPRFIATVPEEAHDIISHTWFWPRVGKFFKPRDVIVTETGTANFGILDVPLPEKSVLVSQVLWGSIGWSVGSALGAALAAQEVGLGRTILFVGDGSLQLTVQELSVMIRLNVKPIIFVLNNSGYTIERYIHGKHRKYNDISNWDWPSLFKVLGDPEEKFSKTYTVHNKQELSQLLEDTTFAQADKIQLVEVIMDKLDAPRALQVQAELSGKTNFYEVAAAV